MNIRREIRKYLRCTDTRRKFFWRIIFSHTHPDVEIRSSVSHNFFVAYRIFNIFYDASPVSISVDSICFRKRQYTVFILITPERYLNVIRRGCLKKNVQSELLNIKSLSINRDIRCNFSIGIRRCRHRRDDKLFCGSNRRKNKCK